MVWGGKGERVGVCLRDVMLKNRTHEINFQDTHSLILCLFSLKVGVVLCILLRTRARARRYWRFPAIYTHTLMEMLLDTSHTQGGTDILFPPSLNREPPFCRKNIA
jgi:hypothetical protein